MPESRNNISPIQLTIAMTAALIAAAILAGASALASEANAPLAAASADARAAMTERQMTDDERLQLLHGILAIPYPGMPGVPPGLPVSAGRVEIGSREA